MSTTEELAAQQAATNSTAMSTIRAKLVRDAKAKALSNSPITQADTRSRFKSAGTVEVDGNTLCGPMPVFDAFNGVSDQWASYTVLASDVGMPDAIASSVYGAAYADMWWVIAYANGVIDPAIDLAAGVVLRIPPIGVVQEYIASRPRPGIA